MANALATTHRDFDLRHVWHGNVQHQGLDQRPPLEVDRADDVWVWDVEGRRYLDAMAGLWCVNVGYGRREIVDAVAAQMTRLPYYPLTQSHGPAAQLAAYLSSLLPNGLSRVFFLYWSANLLRDVMAPGPVEDLAARLAIILGLGAIAAVIGFSLIERMLIHLKREGTLGLS